VSYFTLRIIIILMETIKDLYISAHRLPDCHSTPSLFRGWESIGCGFGMAFVFYNQPANLLAESHRAWRHNLEFTTFARRLTYSLSFNAQRNLLRHKLADQHSCPTPSACGPHCSTPHKKNVNDLPIENNHKTYALPNISLRYPQLAAMQISFNCAKVVHRSGRTQTIPLKWIKTGFGGNYRPRYAFVCQCGRSVISVYCHYDGLVCRYCWNAVYASQVCDRYRRPVLQARRLQAFLKLKAGMWQSTRNRLQARIAAAKADHRYLAHSKRIRHSIVQHPQSNYGARGAMHWD
jgi:hypothetical protein